MNFTLFSHLYAATCYVFCALMCWLIYKIATAKIDIKEEMIFTLSAIIWTVAFYSSFLIANSKLNALFFYELYLIGTVWSIYAVNSFCLAYTNTKTKMGPFKLLFCIIGFIDTVSVLANARAFHVFDLEQLFTSDGYSYWALVWGKGITMHLIACYTTATFTFIILIYNIFSTASFFKAKYITILIAYFLVITVNYTCYNSTFPLDFSAILIAVIVFFIMNYASTNFSSYIVVGPLASINETLSDAILCFDYSGELVYNNSAASRLFNKFGDDLKAYTEQFRLLFLEDKPEEMSLELDNGETHYYVTEYKDFFIKGSVIGSYLKLQDKTEEIVESQKRRYIATHDQLTGLLNRSGFFKETEKALASGVFKAPIIICTNIKDFRLINDIYGESYGDEILRSESQLIQRIGHRKNINGRLTDDKFAVVMEKADFQPETVEEAFNELSALTENGTFHMSISAGIYEIYNKKESVQIIHDKAKMAMDAIKDDYQQVFSYYDSTMMDKLLAEKNIVSEFEKAIDDMQFDIHLQPINDIKGNASGAEALVRWLRPHQEITMPDTFIEILEKTSLVYKLDLYVWELAARKLKDWQNRGFKDKFISVNISSRDKYFIDIAQSLKDIVSKYQIPPENLHLEVQEKSLVEDSEMSLQIFSKLKSAGFKIYIDRFGTGYSSLNMLKDFEADGVKIDTVFLSEDELSDKNKIILQTMISMSEDLGMEVIPEGVETKSHLQQLLKMNCKIFQGFYYSRPLPVREYESIYLK